MVQLVFFHFYSFDDFWKLSIQTTYSSDCTNRQKCTTTLFCRTRDHNLVWHNTLANTQQPGGMAHNVDLRLGCKYLNNELGYRLFPVCIHVHYACILTVASDMWPNCCSEISIHVNRCTKCTVFGQSLKLKSTQIYWNIEWFENMVFCLYNYIISIPYPLLYSSWAFRM